MDEARPISAPRRSGATWDRPLSNSASAALGGLVGAISAVFYFMAAGRSLDFDSSVTVGVFVKTGSVLDPLRRQVALNNHPLFSIVEHVFWTLHLRTETYLRIPPILFGVVTIAIVTAWCAKAFGFVPGLGAGLIVATNPMFESLSRELRGYSLLSLCAVTSTLLLWRLVERNARPVAAWIPVAYVAFVAAGIATHLYGWVVLVVHVGIVVARKEFGPTWFKRWLVAGGLGSLIYLPTIHTVLNTRNERTFYASFPREVAVPLLGQAHIAIAALTLIVLWAVWMARHRPSAVGGVIAMLVFLAFVWIVVQPEFLVFRYLVWLVPGVGVAAAFVVARHRSAVVLVLIAVVAMVAHEAPGWTKTEVPTSETAALIDAARSEGMDVCGVLHTAAGVLAYTRQPRRVMTTSQIAGCDLAVGFYVTPDVNRFERRLFPYAWQIPGSVPAFIYSKRPEATVLSGLRHHRDRLDTHLRTWPS